MTRSISSFFAALLISSAVLVAPVTAMANKGDCGQPSSTGATPKTSDAQTILKAAVGQVTDCTDKPCICDVNSNGTITTPDALQVLKKAVGQGVTLTCTTCPSDGPGCTSAVFDSRLGSDLDSGWTGVAHDSELPVGASITVRVLRRCSDSNVICTLDSECTSNNCKPTCDCDGDKSCEIVGPTHSRACATTLKDCSTNADCPSGVECTWTFGPPLPLSSGGTPACVLSLFDGPLTGTADSGTGHGEMQTKLRSRVFLGIALSQPCPRCGPPSSSLRVGQMFTCEGGQFPGAACRVDGVSASFGGTSFDCPPDLQANVSGAGLAIRFSQVTSRTATRTAQLPCANFSFKSNPLNAPTNPGKCLDNNAACGTNADCKRCTGNSAIACTSDGQCTGNGTCAESPDQPVSCGYWCQCGFCNGNASSPCFQTSDCDQGETCLVGPGIGNAQNAPQQKPNDCSGDKFICGQFEKEKCGTTLQGKCSLQSYRVCSNDTVCASNGAGTCVFEPRSCFEPRITRTGAPSPLASYCSVQDKTCTTNADCPLAEDFCVQQSSRPTSVALFCVPATASGAINSAGGITGPGAVSLKGIIEVCRCGDSKIGCDETCDDGDTNNGDGCNDYCQTE